MTARLPPTMPAEAVALSKRLHQDLAPQSDALSKTQTSDSDSGVWSNTARGPTIKKSAFLTNALIDFDEKAKVFAVQGFGRVRPPRPQWNGLTGARKANPLPVRDWTPLGPLASDSRVTYDIRQDWGVLVWAPLVMLGLVQSLRLGRQQNLSDEPPTAAALVLWVAVTWVVVTLYLPMAGGSLLHAAAKCERPAGRGRTVDDLGSGGRPVQNRRREDLTGDGSFLAARRLMVFVIVLASDAFFWHTRAECRQPPDAHVCDRRSWNCRASLITTVRPATKRGSRVSITPTSYPAIRCLRRRLLA